MAGAANGGRIYIQQPPLKPFGASYVSAGVVAAGLEVAVRGGALVHGLFGIVLVRPLLIF